MRLGHPLLTGLAAGVLSVSLLAGCGGDGASTARPVAISTDVLDSAASFLAAATGKEYEVTVDNVVFVNSVIGLNDVVQDPLNLYGDLWVLLRDVNGAPILDENGCVQPIASEPIEYEGEIVTTVPMMLEEFQDGDFKCGVVPGYEAYTMELEIGRLDVVRALTNNPEMVNQSFQDVITSINASVAIKTDLAGRLVLVKEALDEVSGETVLVESTIDAPLANLAMYRALLVEGRLAGYGVEKIGEEGQVIPAPWLEIRDDLELGDLAYLRDGTPGREGGVGKIKGYADLSPMRHSTSEDYAGKIVTYIQYVEGEACAYVNETDDAFVRVFDSAAYTGVNIAAFARHADDARRVVVFMHETIQELPEVEVAALPGGRLEMLETAAAAMGGASTKEVPLTVDALVFLNTVLGVNNVPFNHGGEIFGDLWALVRDADGVPVEDANGCVQPLASETVTWPDGSTHDTLPMELDVETGECLIVAGYEEYVVEIELGRLDVVRTMLTNPRVMDTQLYEVVKQINASKAIAQDLSGRLLLTQDVLDETTGEPTGETVQKTIDSPLGNLALYKALMEWGKLEGNVEIMQEGQWVTVPVSITLDDAIVNANGLGYLKYGEGECATNPSPSTCSYSRLPGSGYVDYRNFSHNSQTDFQGVSFDYIEYQEGADCEYVMMTDQDLYQTVLAAGDETPDDNIAAFVKQAEDTRKIILFTHEVIHDETVTP